MTLSRWMLVALCLLALIWCVSSFEGVGSDTGSFSGGDDFGGAFSDMRNELAVISFHSKDAPDPIVIQLRGENTKYVKYYNNSTWAVNVFAHRVNNSTEYNYSTYKNNILTKNVSIDYYSYYGEPTYKSEPNYEIEKLIAFIVFILLMFIISYKLSSLYFKKGKGGAD
jgi:hypothetical protein